MKFIPSGSPNTVIQLTGTQPAAKSPDSEEDGHSYNRDERSGGITSLKVYPFKVSLVPRSPASSSSSSRTWRGCVRALLRQLKACPRCRAAGQEFPVSLLPRTAQAWKLPRSSNCNINNNYECNSSPLSPRDSDEGCCAQNSRSDARDYEVVEEYDLVSIDPNCPRHGKYSLTAWLRKRGDSPKELSKDFNNAAASPEGLKKKVPPGSLRGARRHIRKLLTFVPEAKDNLNLSRNARSGRVINRIRSPTTDSRAGRSISSDSWKRPDKLYLHTVSCDVPDPSFGDNRKPNMPGIQIALPAASVAVKPSVSVLSQRHHNILSTGDDADDEGGHCIKRIKPAAKHLNGRDVRRECPGETYASQYRRMCHFKARLSHARRRFFQNHNVINTDCDREAPDVPSAEGVFHFQHEIHGELARRENRRPDENNSSSSSTPTCFFMEERVGRGDGVVDLKELERCAHEEPLACEKGLVLDSRVSDCTLGGGGGEPSMLEGFSGVVQETCPQIMGAQRLGCGEAQEDDGLMFYESTVDLIEGEEEVLSTLMSVGSMIVEGGGEEVARDIHFDLKEREQTQNLRCEFVHHEDANFGENESTTRIELLGDHELSTSVSNGGFIMLKEQHMGSEIILETKEVFKEEEANYLDNERRTIEQILVEDKSNISTQSRFRIMEEQQMANCDIFDTVGQEQDISENLDNESGMIKQLVVGDEPSTPTPKRFIILEQQRMESDMFDMTELDQTSQRLDKIANMAKALQMGLKGHDPHRETFAPIEKVHLTKVEVVPRKEERDYWLCNMAIERARNRVLETCDGGRVCQLVKAFESIK